MIFHDASFADFIRGVKVTFNALFMILKSVILSPPCFFSPIIVNFLIFGGFPSQIKLIKVDFFNQLFRDDKYIVN